MSDDEVGVFAAAEALPHRLHEELKKATDFAEQRGWKVNRDTGVRYLITGRRHDWSCRVPYQDHGFGFTKSGRPIAFVSQPYMSVIGLAELSEIKAWASGHDLSVSFPDIPSWHNHDCMMMVFRRITDVVKESIAFGQLLNTLMSDPDGMLHFYEEMKLLRGGMVGNPIQDTNDYLRFRYDGFLRGDAGLMIPFRTCRPPQVTDFIDPATLSPNN